MFSLDYLDLTNFKSFRGSHRINLPSASGLYYLTGWNEIYPSLGSNGVGKTTILDALRWAITGRTTRGLKAARVVARGYKNASVTVSGRLCGSPFKIYRSQGPNNLTLNDRPVSQDQLLKFIRLNEEAFDHSVMFPQFGTAFFDQKPADKLALFTQILGLDFWLDKAQKASELTAQIEAEKSKLLLKHAKLEGQIDSNQEEERSLQMASQNYAAEFEKKLQEAQSRLVGTNKDIKFLKKRQKENTAAIKQARGRLQAESPKCEACGQILPEYPGQAQLRRNINDFELDFKVNERKLMALLGEVDRLTGLVTPSSKPVNPYAELLEACNASYQQLLLSVSSTRSQIEQLEREHAAISFWVAGFKRIRLLLIDETLRSLEVEVNNALASLGLSEWTVTFDVERENKSGGITKGFSVFIQSPESEEPEPWEAWSGGETQRLRMAGDLGLANLIMEQAGLKNTIEFYDEPSNHLSQEGLLDLCETLAQRAKVEGKVIILVDHHAIDFGDFAGVLTVIKNKEGSHLRLPQV